MKALDDMVLDPMVWYVKSRIEALMQVIQFEKDGESVDPNGFRLKNLNAWAYEEYQSVFESIGSLSGQCNLRCSFCYENGNPLSYDKSILSIKETDTRLKYYSLHDNRGLPQFRKKLYKEPFTNKNLITILRRVREFDSAAEISLTTNGSLLDESLLVELSKLIPLNLSISLNASRPEKRRLLMGDKKSDNCLSIIRQLQSYGLSFIGSIVAWPTLGAQELVETIHFLSENSARIIRVTLPGYTRYYSQEHPFETHEVWQQALKVILPLRKMIKSPLLVLPSLYHENSLTPEITGVIERSPADRARVQVKDRIVSIDGRNIQFRTEAKKALIFAARERRKVWVVFERKGERFGVNLKEYESGKTELYPYRPVGYPPSFTHPFGLVLIDDFDPAWLWDALDCIRDRPEKQIVLMTTPIMEPIIAFLLERYKEAEEILRDRTLHLWIPEQRFWGGNIILGDLYICSDIIQAIDDFKCQSGIMPELVLIPNTFSPNYNTDLLGVSYAAIEQITGIPVDLLQCNRITI